MNDKQYLGINTEFNDLKTANFDEIDVRTSVSVLDYDAVIINTSWILSAYSSNHKYQGLPVLSSEDSVNVVTDYNRLKTEFEEFLNSGRNVYVILSESQNCHIYTGEIKYSGTGRNARQTNIVNEFDGMSFLPFNIKLRYSTGNKIVANCSAPFKNFFCTQRDNLYYSAYFLENVGIPLAKISNSERVVSAVVEYGRGKIVFLPDCLKEEAYKTINEWKKQTTYFLQSIFDLDRSLTENGEMILPEWTSTIYMPGEAELKDKINKSKKKLDKVIKEIEKNEAIITEKRSLKYLLSGTGTLLENKIKGVLEKIGFVILPSEVGRADICAEFNGQPIICEVKGLTKSAGEKNAAQLEKWAASYIEENGKIAKPILIINTFKDLPLENRTEESFPKQMIPYAVSRGQCLITTSQLLCMFIDISNNVNNKDMIIEDFLNTNGVYEKYKNYNEFF